MAKFTAVQEPDWMLELRRLARRKQGQYARGSCPDCGKPLIRESDSKTCSDPECGYADYDI